MNQIIKTLAGLGLTLAVLGGPHAYAAVFNLNPSGGDIYGHPGDTIGWGFTLYNDTANYLVVAGAAFEPAAGLGTFTDFLGPQFLEIAPGATAVQAFDLVQQLGLGSFAIAHAAPAAGLVESGRILVSFDLYARSTGDGDFNPDTDTVSTGNTLTAAAAVPAPASLVLLSAGLLVLLRRLRRRLQ